MNMIHDGSACMRASRLKIDTTSDTIAVYYCYTYQKKWI